MLVKTIEEAFKNQGLDINVLPDVSMLPKKYQQASIDFYKTSVLCDELNDGWEPDWSNNDQPKYQIWWGVLARKKSPGGVGLSFNNADNFYQHTNVPSRLCFKNRETARYAAENFAALFSGFYVNQ